ncbi:RNA-directed DNA polymerase, eukaryota [Tanacetum coccineum]
MPERGRTSDQYIDMQQALHHLELSDRVETWQCTMQHDGSFTVACIRKHIDEKILHSGDTETRWNNIVPIKVNILVWRIRLDRLPTRENLIVRGIDILSILCPSCGDAMEDNDNVFVKCVIAIDAVNVRQKARGVLEAIFISSVWVMWQYRNKVIVEAVKMKKSVMFDRIVSHSFEWCSSRGKNVFSNWLMRLQSSKTFYV